MDAQPVHDLPDVETLVRLLDSIFSEINLGLLVYHLEDPDEASSLRLVYVNAAASAAAGSDLTACVGLEILDAFPSLAETDLPETYARVAREKAPRRLGTIEYEDARLEHRYYAVRAFPMPNECVCVVFENISIRKQIDTKVQQRTAELRRQYDDLHQHTDTLVQALQLHLDALVETLAGNLTPAQRRHVEALQAAAAQLTDGTRAASGGGWSGRRA